MSSRCSSSPTTDGIPDPQASDDTTRHHCHGTADPTPDQRKHIPHARKDNNHSGIVVHALQATGSAFLRDAHLDLEDGADIDRLLRRSLKYVDTIRVPGPDADPRDHWHNAFLVPGKELGWFAQVLAATSAAGQLAWTGAGREISRYLTAVQGRQRYQENTFAGAASVRDAHHKFGGELFVGTDQVFRLDGQRVEAFSGIASSLYKLLEAGKVEEYRRRAYEKRNAWPTGTTAHGWGPVSFRDDGTLMALRILPARRVVERGVSLP